MKKVLILLLFAAFTLTTSAQETNSIPNITLKSVDGAPINISDYAKDGKITVFSFWATWCSPCKKELGNLAELYDEWKSEYGVEIVAVSIDDIRNLPKVKTYINGVSWPFVVLVDPNEDMKRILNFQTIPYTILVDQKGNIVYRHNSYVEGDEYVLEDKIKALKK